MEYVQERVTTLHDFGAAAPEAPTERAAVVVPMDEREYAGLAAERVLSELERLDLARVVVPLRVSAERFGPFEEWLSGFDLPLSVLWCDGPNLESLLSSHGLDGARGKGRDVWLAFGRALEAGEYVVVHDADAKTYDRSYVRRLLFPLAREYAFSKGYYARVEDDHLYGRLFRLFFAPLTRTLADAHDADVLRYLEAFRYALAGEFAATREAGRRLRFERSWGVEIGTLGDAFEHAGFEASAQVDLGAYEHDHRAVGGPTGLSDMSGAVGAALFRVLADHGVDPDFETLPGRYRETAAALARAYRIDAAFNGLRYDRDGERSQVETYADAIRPPDGTDAACEPDGVDAGAKAGDPRLPAWADAPISPSDVREAVLADQEAVR